MAKGVYQRTEKEKIRLRKLQKYRSKLRKNYKHSAETKIKIGLANKISLKGRKLSLETKKRISEANKGHIAWNKGKKGVFLEEARRKMSEAKKGNKCHLWKGGKSKVYLYKHIKNIDYKIWRAKVFERDNWTCQTCWKRGCYLEPHHIKGWSKYKKLRYEVENGVTLCYECHKLTRKKH